MTKLGNRIPWSDEGYRLPSWCVGSLRSPACKLLFTWTLTWARPGPDLTWAQSTVVSMNRMLTSLLETRLAGQTFRHSLLSRTCPNQARGVL